MSRRSRLTIESLEARNLLAASPILSEFVASNDKSLLDGFGVNSDWIEIQNAGDESVDLLGYYLSDDANNLTKWSFPESTILQAGERLVVFASGQNVTDPSGAIHTNFRLKSAGEDLVLTDPSGKLLSALGENGAGFPKQFSGISYGIGQATQTDNLVDGSNPAQVLIPSSSELGNTWTSADFQTDAAWRNGLNGVGFDTNVSSPDGTILRLDFNDDDSGESGNANSEAGWQSFQLNENGALYDGIRVTVSGIGGIPVDDRDRSAPVDNLPALTYDQIFDDFIFASSQTDGTGIEVLLEGLTAGRDYEITLWSFDAGSVGDRVSNWNEVANGLVLPIEQSYSFTGSDAPASDMDNAMSAILRASADGTLRIQGTRNGGTSFGVFLNGLQISAPNAVALIQTDVQATMHNQQATSYVRLPFTVGEDQSYDHLELEVQYDSGFVAHLNGQEIARRNFTGVPQFNSSADSERTLNATLQSELINVSAFANMIQSGENVLAIHAMNSSADDADFLIRANLNATLVDVSSSIYFATPTPGEPNTGDTFFGFAADTNFSIDRGYYDQPFTVAITSDTPGGSIVYTTDGSAPSLQNGQIIEAADANSTPVAMVDVTTTSYVRAFAFKPQFVPSNVDTHSYIFLNDVVRQDPQADPNAPNYPDRWQANATGDYEMDPEVVAQWDDENPANDDFGIREALLSIPTMSIVMDHDDLWDQRTGIYVNSNTRGESWRRAGSVEYFDPNTGEEFQIDAGVQIHGGASRDNVRLKKHSFRLLFRDDFGPGSLNFPLYSDTNNEQFNTLVLRAFFTDAFATRSVTDRYNPVESQYLRDIWMKDTQLAMGNPSAHNTYVHLYMNGLYWGLYNPSERPDDAFLATYLGGEREDWDIVKDFNETFAGNKTAWNGMFELARELPTAPNPDAIYHQLQGNNPDGTPNPDLPNLLDVDNLIDFMLLHLHTGVEDWPHHNWYAGRNRVDPNSEGFKFFVWDQEISVDHRYRDRTDVGVATDHRFTPAELYDKLRRSSPEFRLRFADRVHLHLNNGGALSVEANQLRYATRAAEIEKAIIGESARWGDAREGEQIRLDNGGPVVTIPVMTVDLWRDERDRVLNEIFPTEEGLTFERFGAIGLTSPLTPPLFEKHGGVVETGFSVQLSAPQDPLLVETAIMPEFSTATAIVPRDGSLDSADPNVAPVWAQVAFDDAAWIQGTGGVGFEGRSGYENLLGIDLMDESIAATLGSDANADGTPDLPTVYARFPFELGADFDAAAFDRMTLNMKYDDGFVAFLNGQRITSANARDDFGWNALATASHEAEVTSFESFNVSDNINLLRPGQTNVLAIVGFNRTVASNDFVISPELTIGAFKEIGEAPVYFTLDGTDPRLPGGQINLESAKLFDGSFSIADTADVKARAFAEGVWSAMTTATFTVNVPDPADLAITEINYNPYPPTPSEIAVIPSLRNDDFEFLELHNTSDTETISLLGMKFDNGIQFEIPAESLAPGEYAVVVQNPIAFALRYGSEPRVLGSWTGSLANAGEQISLLSENGDQFLNFNFGDGNPWPTRADGAGATLELIDPNSTDTTSLSKHYVWRASTEFGGSPGRTGQAPIGVVVNEVVSRTDSPAIDAIELYNTSSQSIDISGWFLSDSQVDFLKFEIPAGTTIDAGDYLVFDESQFNPTPASPAANHFALDGSDNDDVWLVIPNRSGGIASFVDDVHFGASTTNGSLGRVETGTGNLARTLQVTLGDTNTSPQVGPIVISEFNYNPTDPSAAALAIYSELNAGDLEFVEIHNPTNVSVDLADWRIRGGIGYEFKQQSLAAGETLVVTSFDPAKESNALRTNAFRAHYGLTEQVSLVGGYSGQLSNSFDRIVLQRAEISPNEPNVYLVEDEVLFDDRTPWATLADGQGQSLHRSDISSYGYNANAWQGATPNPGSFLRVVPNGDFNNDGQEDMADLDLLCSGVQSAENRFDLTGDGIVDRADVERMLDQVLGTVIGDTNLDRAFNSTDLVRIFQAGEYEDNFEGNSLWSEGDWNCDGDFTTRDLVAAFQADTYVAEAVASSVASNSDLAAAVDLAIQHRDDDLARAFPTDERK